MSDRTKLAAEIPVITQEAATTLRKLANDNVDLVRRVETLEQEKRAMLIARRMEDRGLDPTLSFEEKVSALAVAEPSKIAAIEAALDMSMGFRLGKVAAAEDRGGEDFTVDSLDDYILSGQALS